ncbi:MAG: bifunctional phosphopantothenoylcysteine decarboxylase/phosphopantothenate--cysteine ligase CoaBC [Syntrophobacteraceae bacterium]|jgi:phosphopantothenoylcysteine decarboxylase/phosphopantothenate--cysteine ligase|nr:bifunctional phosphopantothenoylcysteine decarboxylase/phosphopantothenate--cysteine ligase CoaBC [Syntrophobacteraceae bacterium]
MRMFNGKSILLGVSGGIAAYKAAELARSFIREGAGVQVVMTAGAQRFITPLTLQVLSEQPVATDLFDPGLESQIGHIQMARAAHLVVVAPATANVLAKAAAGLADDYLTTVLLATTAPVLFCPAMNTRMLEHPATRRSLETLRQLGYSVLEPDAGQLACGEEGAGRLPDPPVILEAACRLLTPPSLQGRRFLVSAGPTWEPLDPVRFITNPSSGKMGFALARMAARRGAEVTLVSGPSSLASPTGISTVRVRTALDMEQAVLEHARNMDAIIMTAAVGDYRPAHAASQKIKKSSDTMTIPLIRNPDILASLGKSRPHGVRQVLVGFAAETEHLIENAREKLIQKNLDFIVANNLGESGSGFGVDTNRVKIIDPTGAIEELPMLTKDEVAARILDRVESILS